MKYLCGITVVLFGIFCLSCCERPVLKPTRVLRDGENRAYVFDGVFGKRMLAVTSNLVKSYAPWNFVHPDPYYGIEKTDNGDLHWYAPFSPEAFANSLIWKNLKKGLKGTGMLEGRNFLPYEVHGVMLMRGFSPVVFKGKNKGDMYIRIFLTNKMKKNDYSELILYNKKEEIFGCVHPKFGRVALWNDTVDFLFKPPSMFFEQGEYSLLIKATTDQEKFEESQKKYTDFLAEKSQKSNRPFPYTNTSDDKVSKINLTEHLAYKFTDRQDRLVAVFDNVVPKEELDAVRTYFLDKNSGYAYAPYDPEKSEEHDNVNWIVKVKANVITDSRIWKYVKHVVTYLSNESNWYPYDVAMNIIQHAHGPRIHSDCSEKEFEYTFLMYLSPEWESEKYGETIFVERRNDTEIKRQRGNEKYETLGAVVPKYGRIAVFRNIIDHSARPPSPDFLAARYTFAVKVGRSREIALAKTLREVLDQFLEEPKSKALQEEIYDGKYDTTNDAATDRFLSEELESYHEKADKNKHEDMQQSYKLLKFKQTLLTSK